jgi:glycosyltransferase involved in cell wall biosynthesis
VVVGIDNISPGESTGKAALGGMRNYLQDLLELLPAQNPDWKFVLFTPEWADSFDDKGAKNLSIVRCPLKRGRFARVIYEQFGLPKEIERNGVNVWLGTCNTLPLSAKCRKVLVVQSLQYFTHSGTYKFFQRHYLRTMASESIKAADRVIALSEASRNEIVNRFRIAREKVQVVHHCLQGHLQGQSGDDADGSVAARLVPGNCPFVMMVSALYPYKNHARLIEAFSRIHVDFPKYRLVIVGADSPGLTAAELRETARKMGVEDKFVTLGRVASSDLAALYRRADVMAMPSIDETFGLTVLEAMHFGCPVITSNTSSMAEVGGEAALLVDPLSVEEISTSLRKVLGDADLRNAMREKGLARAALFTRDRMTQKTMAMIGAARQARESKPQE